MIRGGAASRVVQKQITVWVPPGGEEEGGDKREYMPVERDGVHCLHFKTRDLSLGNLSVGTGPGRKLLWIPPQEGRRTLLLYGVRVNISPKRGSI